MKVKYNRKSTSEQSMDRQLQNSNEFDLIINDTSSGSIPFKKRNGGAKIVTLIENKNITEVVVSSIDRLGRSILDIISTVEYFTKNDVNLFVENLGLYSMINSQPSDTFKLIASVLGSVSEIEKKNILERQRQGIAIAKLKGVYKGRANGTRQPNSRFIKKYKVAYDELLQGSTLKRASLLGECSIGTCQRLKKLL